MPRRTPHAIVAVSLCLAFALLAVRAARADDDPAATQPMAQVQVEWPAGWVAKTPKSKAVLKMAVCPDLDAVIALSTSLRSEFKDDVDLMGWAKLVKRAAAKDGELQNRAETDLKRGEIAGRPTVEYEVSGAIRGVKLHYRIIMLEANGWYCKVTGWTSQNGWAAAQKSFEDVVAGVQVGNDDALKQFIVERVQEMNNATITGDFAKVVDLTYPKIVEAMGGRDKMLSSTEAVMKAMKAKGIELRSCTPSTPSDPVKSGSELFVVAPFVMDLKIPGGRLLQKTFVIGISGDTGKSWSFANGDLDRTILKQLVPSLPEALKLPEKQKPVLEKE